MPPRCQPSILIRRPAKKGVVARLRLLPTRTLVPGRTSEQRTHTHTHTPRTRARKRRRLGGGGNAHEVVLENKILYRPGSGNRCHLGRLKDTARARPASMGPDPSISPRDHGVKDPARRWQDEEEEEEAEGASSTIRAGNRRSMPSYLCSHFSSRESSQRRRKKKGRRRRRR